MSIIDGQTTQNARLTAEEIGKLAYRNEKPEQGFDYIDWLLWFMLRDIYNQFRAGTMEIDSCVKRKEEAVNIWEKERFRDDQMRQSSSRAAELWKNVEAAASQYRKNRTLENADLVMVAIYGIKLQPDGEGADNG